jgi:tetratricopeptide (TPR) repeat protein
VEASSEGLETIAGDRVTASPSSRPRDGLRRGETVDRYIVLDCIGRGGMGAVYAAFDPQLDRKIALKLLHSERIDGEHLLVEARAMAQLDHPNTVTVHDVGEHDGRVFLAMEYIDGTTLRDFLGATRPSWRVVLAAFVQAGRGLAAAHARGLLHRDFKPENVMVDREGADDPRGPARVRVLDFGLARADRSDLTISGRVPVVSADDAHSGTPAYMAPEQFLGTAVGAPADQFAFCVALFEALTGVRPFAGRTPTELAACVIAGEIRDAGGGTPPWLRRVVERGLAADPARRWPTMDALLDALGRDPTRRRRILFGLLGGAALVGAAIAAVRIEHARDLEACESDDPLAARTWNAAIADEIGDAFAASKLGYATDAWARARVRIDAIAQSWHTTSVATCRARLEGEQTPATAAATRTCLADLEDRLSVLVERLRLASPTAIEEAIGWVGDLPEPSSCDDPKSTAHLVARADEASSSDVREIRRALLEVDALRLDSQAPDAMALAESLIERTSALGHASLLAKARIAWAAAANTAEREQPRVLAELLQAFHAATVTADDEVALRAAISIAYHTTRALDRSDEAIVWCKVADAFRQRLGLPDDSPAAIDIMTAIGSAERRAGRYDQAHERLSQVVAMGRASVGADHPQLAEALGNLAVIDIDRSHFDDAVEALTEGISIGQRAYGANHPRLAWWYSVLAVTYARWGRVALGEPYLRRAIEIDVAAKGPDHPVIARHELNLGAMLIEAGRHTEAVAVLEKAVATLRKGSEITPHSLAGALQNLGNARSELGDHRGATTAYDEAIALFRESVGPRHADTARAIMGLGRACERNGELELARRHYTDALAVLEDDSGPLRAETYVALGRAANLAGDHVAAEDACRRAYDGLRQVPAASRGGGSALCLAVARWHNGGDKAEVVALVREARDNFVQVDAHAHVAALDAWLREGSVHAPPPYPSE